MNSSFPLANYLNLATKQSLLWSQETSHRRIAFNKNSNCQLKNYLNLRWSLSYLITVLKMAPLAFLWNFSFFVKLSNFTFFRVICAMFLNDWKWILLTSLLMSSNVCKVLATNRRTEAKSLQSLCKTRDKVFTAENIFKSDNF